jgi:hypothetical protein
MKKVIRLLKRAPLARLLLCAALTPANARQAVGVEFARIFAHPLKVSISECVQGLQLIAEVAEPEDVSNLVTYLPFR